MATRSLGERVAESRPDFELGSRVLEALLSAPSWRHRKVESLRFTDEELGRRRVSIDCTVPSGLEVAEGLLVPLGFAVKAPLRMFDITNGEGQSLSILGRHDNGFLSWSALCFAASEDLGVGYTREVEETIGKIVLGSPASAQSLTRRLLYEDAADFGLDDTSFSYVTGMLLQVLSAQFLLTAVVAAGTSTGSRRQVITYSYAWSATELGAQSSGLEAGERTRARRTWANVLSVLDLASTSYELPIASATDYDSYHLEVLLPKWLRGTRLEIQSAHDIVVDENAGTVLHAVGSFADIDTADPASHPKAQLTIRADRAGAPFAASVVVAYAFAVFLLEEVLPGARTVLRDNHDGAVSLLLLVPAAIGLFATRPRENVPIRRILAVHRGSAWICCGLLIASAWTLVGELREPWISWVWFGGLVFSATLLTHQCASLLSRIHGWQRGRRAG